MVAHNLIDKMLYFFPFLMHVATISLEKTFKKEQCYSNGLAFEIWSKQYAAFLNYTLFSNSSPSELYDFIVWVLTAVLYIMQFKRESWGQRDERHLQS